MPSHAAYVVHLKRNIVSIFMSEGLSFLVASAARAYRLSDFNRIFAEVRGKHGPVLITSKALGLNIERARILLERSLIS